MHTKGHAAQETRAAAERARLLIENAEALGEPPKDPLLLFSVLSLGVRLGERVMSQMGQERHFALHKTGTPPPTRQSCALLISASSPLGLKPGR
jgi:hypothetical protein